MEVAPRLSLSRRASSSSLWTGRGSGTGSLSRHVVQQWPGRVRSRGLGQPRASLSGPEWEGSAQLQQLLVEQVRLQIGEVQVQQVVDAESQRLRSLVRDGMGRDLDRIAIRAMKGADDMSNRVSPRLLPLWQDEGGPCSAALRAWRFRGAPFEDGASCAALPPAGLSCLRSETPLPSLVCSARVWLVSGSEAAGRECACD